MRTNNAERDDKEILYRHLCWEVLNEIDVKFESCRPNCRPSNGKSKQRWHFSMNKLIFFSALDFVKYQLIQRTFFYLMQRMISGKKILKKTCTNYNFATPSSDIQLAWPKWYAQNLRLFILATSSLFSYGARIIFFLSPKKNAY